MDSNKNGGGTDGEKMRQKGVHLEEHSAGVTALSLGLAPGVKALSLGLAQEPEGCKLQAAVF